MDLFIWHLLNYADELQFPNHTFQKFKTNANSILLCNIFGSTHSLLDIFQAYNISIPCHYFSHIFNILYKKFFFI